MRIKWSKAAIAAVIALVIGAINVNSVAAAGLMEQIQKLSSGAQAESPAAAPAAVATPPLGKLAASGRVTETIDSGGCPNSVIATSCSPATDCAQIQFQGPVTVPALGPGKSNLTACLTVDNTAISPTFSVCFDGLGKGTITSANGKNSVNFSMGGLLCDSDLPTAISVMLITNTTYAVQGGSGAFANAVGNGNLSVSALIATIPPAPPFPATGQVNFVGTLAKQ
jgi:hypothetical protein